MAFRATTSAAITFIATLFLLLALNLVSTASAVPSGNKHHNTDQKLLESFKQNEELVYTGVFILCEQYKERGPHARVFTHSGPSARYSVGGTCFDRIIRGTVDGTTETNHARLLNFPGLYDYFELGSSCTGDQKVEVSYHDGSKDVPVFSCDRGSDATFVLFGANILV